MFLIPQNKWVIKNTETKGRGVFATEEIPIGTVIGDYVGKLIRPEEEDEYERKYGLYVMEFNDQASIFADPSKTGVHLLNHSCANNCDTYPYQGHTLVFALRHIFKDEELTISYILDAPSDEDTKTYPCFCQSPLCRGTMHATSNESERVGKHIDDLKSDGHHSDILPVDFGKELPPLAEYPVILEYEDIKEEVYDIFGSLIVSPLECQESKLPPLAEIRKKIS